MFANISSIVEFLPAALASFLDKFPDIHIHLEEHVSTGVAAGVADNLADFGILGSLAAVDGLTLTPFRSDELVVVLKPDHPLASTDSLSFASLVQLPLVGLHANSSLHHLLARAAADEGRPLNVRIRVTSFDAVCAMVAAGRRSGCWITCSRIRRCSLIECVHRRWRWIHRERSPPIPPGNDMLHLM